MPPENQQPPQENVSYDFILKTEEPKPPSLFARLNKKNILIFIILICVFLTVFLVVLSKLNEQANMAQRKKLIEIAQYQTEISRLATIGSDQAEKAQTQARAQAIRSNMDESLKGTENLLNARGGTFDETTLSGKKNSQSDDQLAKANTYKTFDKTFDKLIDKTFLDYQRALLSATATGNNQEKQVLQADYKEADAILGLVDQQ
jgi:hypothetical protein